MVWSQRERGKNLQATTENRGTDLAVYNWAYARGIQPMRYDWSSDTWIMSDGEPYTTTLILREAAENGEDNTI